MVLRKKRIKRVFKGREGFKELRKKGFTRIVKVTPKGAEKIPRFSMSSKPFLTKDRSKAIRLSKTINGRVFEIPNTGFTIIAKRVKRKKR